MSKRLSRRDFMKASLIGGAALVRVLAMVIFTLPTASRPMLNSAPGMFL